MSKRNKTIAGWIAFLFVCFHISALFMFASPAQLGMEKGRTFVSPYVVPLFQQTWAMFAPCPYVEGRIYVKIAYEDELVDWFDPRENDRQWHKYLRGSHHGDRILLEANVVHYVWAAVEDFDLNYQEPIPENLAEAFTETAGYIHAKRYAYGVARNYRDEKPEKIWVKVELNNLLTEEQGVIELPVMTWW